MTGKCFWVPALLSAGIFQLCKCGQSYTYLKCNILHITGTSNYANGAEGILDSVGGEDNFTTQSKYWPRCQLQAFKSYWAALFHPHLHLIYWGRIRIFEPVIQAMHNCMSNCERGTTKTYMKRKDETLSRYYQWSLTITWIFFLVNRQLWRKYKSPILSQHKTLL